MSSVTFGPLDYYDIESARRIAGDLLNVYRTAHGAIDQTITSIDDLQRSTGVTTNDFELLTRGVNGELSGYAFGSVRMEEPHSWKRIAAAFPQVPVPEETAPLYVLGDVAVVPVAQQRGHGRTLIEGLLFERYELVAIANVPADNAGARAAFRSWGWKEIDATTVGVPLPLAQAYTD